jgi:hypothetical protein
VARAWRRNHLAGRRSRVRSGWYKRSDTASRTRQKAFVVVLSNASGATILTQVLLKDSQRRLKRCGPHPSRSRAAGVYRPTSCVRTAAVRGAARPDALGCWHFAWAATTSSVAFVDIHLFRRQRRGGEYSSRSNGQSELQMIERPPQERAWCGSVEPLRWPPVRVRAACTHV